MTSEKSPRHATTGPPQQMRKTAPAASGKRSRLAVTRPITRTGVVHELLAVVRVMERFADVPFDQDRDELPNGALS